MSTITRLVLGVRRGRCAAMMLLSAFVLLSGCGGIIPLGPAPNLYNLTPKNTFPEDLPLVEQQVVVEEPLAAGGLDSNRIALRPSTTELKYFANARWTERAPKMVQTLLVESLENSGSLAAVGRQAIGLRSDYNIKTELREFQAEYFDTAGNAPLYVCGSMSRSSPNLARTSPDHAVSRLPSRPMAPPSTPW